MRKKIFSKRILPPTKPPFIHFPPISVFSTCFGSNEPLRTTEIGSVFILTDEISLYMLFFSAQVNNYSIYDVEIWSYFYRQTAEMELYQLEEMAGSEKTGFCGLYGANSTGGRGWGAEGSAVGKTMVALA